MAEHLNTFYLVVEITKGIMWLIMEPKGKRTEKQEVKIVLSGPIEDPT